MAEKVVVDTYALLSMAFGELTKKAEEVMLDIRSRKIEGIITPAIVFEFTVHWLRGRIPALKSLSEVKSFLQSYFSVIDLSFEDFIEGAKIKVEGDKIVSTIGRKLSIVDAISIQTAKKLKAKILTGDKDLTLVANKMGIEVIW
ncbi:MAG: PIN domain-containing protein [Sulfolobaceae archaeon]